MLKILLIASIICSTHGYTVKPPRVIKNATQFESPWDVYISIKNRICSGLLINDLHVLTAAHCFDYIKYSEFNDLQKLRKVVTLRIGEWKTGTDPDCDDNESEESCDTTADIFVRNITIHESYDKRNENLTAKFVNDIAIIELSWPPRRSELINVIEITDSKRCHESVTGEQWKLTSFGQNIDGDYSTIKKKSEIEIISNEECKRKLSPDLLIKYNPQTHVCGKGSNGESTCKGDAGGAVTNLIEGIQYLEGIVSFTKNECTAEDQNSPSVFLKVSCFYDWIVSKIPKLKKKRYEKPVVTSTNEPNTNAEKVAPISNRPTNSDENIIESVIFKPENHVPLSSSGVYKPTYSHKIKTESNIITNYEYLDRKSTTSPVENYPYKTVAPLSTTSNYFGTVKLTKAETGPIKEASPVYSTNQISSIVEEKDYEDNITTDSDIAIDFDVRLN